MQQPNTFIRSFEHHNEFVFGLDLSLFIPNQIVAASWDEHVSVFNSKGPSPARIPMVQKPINAQKPQLK